MYESFFNLKEAPFNVTPDPRFVYFSQQHREALSTLIYGVESRRGFIQITGEIGTGKTTLCRALLQRMSDRVHSALVFNPKLSEFELLQTIVEDFGIKPSGKKRKDYFDSLNRFLLEQLEEGYNAIVIIDEAQLLSPKALEQIRLLSNLETSTQKLLQIILVGQPELKDLLNRKDLVQLYQRITIRYHLTVLSREEVDEYIRHRLQVAGGQNDFFTPEAIDRIHQISGGVPRLINVLADRSLMAAFTQSSRLIDTGMVDYAYGDLQGVRA
ncbi:MAG TPA: AAA family ATPase [Verrucomicrobiae bacterium]|nr:AAA family ATPase [Verrucomicrobiae bacterium]